MNPDSSSAGLGQALALVVRDPPTGRILVLGRGSEQIVVALGDGAAVLTAAESPHSALLPAGLALWNAAGVALDDITAQVASVAAAADDVIVVRPSVESWDPSDGLPPLAEDWARAFADAGFARDLEDTVCASIPDAARYRRLHGGIAELAFAYERRFSVLTQASEVRRRLLVEQREALARGWQAESMLAERDARLAALHVEAHDLREETKRLGSQVAGVEAWRDGLFATPAWRIAHGLQRARGAVLPPGSRRDEMLHELAVLPDVARRRGVAAAIRNLATALGPPAQQSVVIEPVTVHLPPRPNSIAVDVIVCVHDALEDVRACLASVVETVGGSANLILVDDGSGNETRDYLADFAVRHGAALVRNDSARGYTVAANQGLAASTGTYACLLNSDTIVPAGWLDALVACAETDSRIGLLGPLSNTASWQGIPDAVAEGDWAFNPLPEGLSVGDVAAQVARFSARLYPSVPFLNGFCMLVRRACVAQVGPFDERAFPAGYGEENDMALRARKMGWRLALADDAYVYHAQSASYGHTTRKDLADRAGTVLAGMHGAELIEAGVRELADGRVMRGLRVRARAAPERGEWEERGRSYAGQRILFVLPLAAVSGGGNVVLFEARTLRRMGIDVAVYNSLANRSGFEAAYPGLDIPVLYGDRTRLATEAASFDAVVATAHYSVDWLSALPEGDGGPVRGYYVQDFEPYMQATGSSAFQAAWASYTGAGGLVRFCKTEWNARQVRSLVGVDCTPIGVAVDVDLFCPRPRRDAEWPDRPLRVAAMIRPASPYRSPEMTMDVLREISRRHGRAVEPWLFGVAPDDPALNRWRREFSWKCAGLTTPAQTVALLNEVDVFVDFSTYQAMGLTALEAMACGAAVIVPAEGGATEFVRHEVNGLVADTSGAAHCVASLDRLVTDTGLRAALQRRALEDAAFYYPEAAAVRMLEVLFGTKG